MMVRRAVVRLQRQFYCFLHHNPVLKDSVFATSYLVPQPVVAAVRTAVFAYCFAVLTTNLVVNIAHGAGWSWAAYFTTLTFFGITLYFGVAAWVTVRYTWLCRSRQAVSPQRQATAASISHPVAMTAEQQRQLTPKELQHVATGVPSEPTASTSATVVAGPEQQRPLLVDIAVPEDEISEQRAQDAAEINNQAVEGEERRAGVVGRRASTVHQLVLAAQWLLYESFICYAPLVTIVYWVLLYPTQTAEMATAVDWWMGVSMHAFNMVLMVLEVFVLARCPCHWRHFGPIAGFMVLYLGLVYFMVAVYGFYVYPFFQPRYFGGYIAVMCLLIVNIAAIIWTIQLMVHRLRDTLYPRWLARHSNSTAAALPSPQPATLADSLASSAEKQRLPSDLS